MTLRRPIIAGNWKMFKTPSEAALLAEDLKDLSAMTGSIDIVVCPPFTALERVVTVLGGSGIGVGAQDHPCNQWKPAAARYRP